MDQATVTQRIVALLDGVDVVTTDGDAFFFYDPGDRLPVDRRFPFATIVTSDNDFDHLSNLNRDGVFRLNVGLSKPTFASLFDDAAAHDFTALDRLMPHPTYGRMHWVCVLNPSEATFASMRPLLVEAHGIAMKRYRKPPADA